VESTENWSGAKTGYLHVRFMKPGEGKSAALTIFERDIWKPYYEDAVRAGINTGWAFGTVRFAAEDYPYTRIWFAACPNSTTQTGTRHRSCRKSGSQGFMRSPAKALSFREFCR
jgi:hypothetical protein